MGNTVKFVSRSYGRLNNALHLRLHKDVYNAIIMADLSPMTLHIDQNELESYQQRISLLEDITKEATAMPQTKQLAELNDERVKLITHIFGKVRASLDSPIEAEWNSAERLAMITDKYKGLQRESYLEVTTHIGSFVIDMNKFKGDWKVVGIDAVMNMLVDKNAEFAEVYNGRRQQMQKTALPAAKPVRREADAMLDSFLDSIYASYLLVEDDTTKLKMQGLIEEINSIVMTVRHTAVAKEAQRTREDKTDKDGDKPSGGEAKPNDMPAANGGNSEVPDDSSMTIEPMPSVDL